MELNTAARHASQTGECAPGTDVTTFVPSAQQTFTEIGVEIKRSRKKRARAGHKIPFVEAGEGLIDDREEWCWTNLGQRPYKGYTWLYYSGRYSGRAHPPAPLRGGTGGANLGRLSVFQHRLGVSAPT